MGMAAQRPASSHRRSAPTIAEAPAGGADVRRQAPALARTRSTDVASELKKVIRLAARDPEALEGELPMLSALHRVSSTGPLDESARVHLILHRLIPEYLARLPAGRDCHAIRELLTWEDGDGQVRSLTTRYHKAATHLINAASDFGRRQEPRLLRECARRFIALDHEDRLAATAGAAAAAAATGDAPVQLVGLQTPAGGVQTRDRATGIAHVHRNLDHRQLVDCMADAEEIVILDTWIAGLDILAEALFEALARGAYVSVLMLHPESRVAQLGSHALQGAPRARFGDRLVEPCVHHSLDVLAAMAGMVGEDHRRRLRVRLYNSLPSISVYAIDDRAFVSFFVRGRRATKSVQVEVLGQDSAMGQLIFGELDALWGSGYELVLTQSPTERVSWSVL